MYALGRYTYMYAQIHRYILKNLYVYMYVDIRICRYDVCVEVLFIYVHTNTQIYTEKVCICICM